ncbi:hypothetical protein BH11PAT4_BH11PAT4_4200 [soil metagenome]
MSITLSEKVSTRLALVAFLLGTTFLIGGVIPNLFPKAPVAEAAVKHYTTSWTAKRMLQVKYGRGVDVCTKYKNNGGWFNQCTEHNYGVDYTGSLTSGQHFMGGTIVGFYDFGFNHESTAGTHANIGVAEWEVRGQVQSANTFYKERWSIPGGSQLDFRIEDYVISGSASGFARRTVINNPGVTSDMFSIGYADKQYAVRFYTVPAPTTSDTGAGNLLLLDFGNGASNCHNISSGDDNCIVTTGAYGWIDADAVDQGRGTRGVNGMGSFIPLRWTVTGAVCETAQETACQ